MTTKKRYPYHPGSKGKADTGPAGADIIAPKVPNLHKRILAAMEQGPATAEQVSEIIGHHWMVVRARCSELAALGLLVDTGQRGAGALGGKVIIRRLATADEIAAFKAEQAAKVTEAAG